MRGILGLFLSLALALSVAVQALAATAPSSGGQPPSAAASAAPAPGKGPVARAAIGKVDINSATAEDLVAVKGIGPSMAQAIIQYRSDHGGFGSVDELLNVRGIGQKTLDRLRNSLTVGKK